MGLAVVACWATSGGATQTRRTSGEPSAPPPLVAPASIDVGRLRLTAGPVRPRIELEAGDDVAGVGLSAAMPVAGQVWVSTTAALDGLGRPALAARLSRPLGDRGTASVGAVRDADHDGIAGGFTAWLADGLHGSLSYGMTRPTAEPAKAGWCQGLVGRLEVRWSPRLVGRVEYRSELRAASSITTLGAPALVGAWVSWRFG